MLPAGIIAGPTEGMLKLVFATDYLRLLGGQSLADNGAEPVTICRVVASDAFGLGIKKHVNPLPVSAVYSVPQVAGVGLTEEQARTAGVAYNVGRCRFAMLPAGIIAGHTEGMLKLVFATDDLRLLGVHSLGDIAAELVALGQVVIHRGANLEIFNDLTFANPTYTMAYKDAAFDGLTRVAWWRGRQRQKAS